MGCVPARPSVALLHGCDAETSAYESTMADNPDIRGTQDRDRINLSQAHEVKYWTKALGVTEQRLREVVQRVGSMAENVRRELGKMKQ
jgi:hypothetical protein